MSDEDYDAMIELASEMSWADAARFIRSETGHGLRQSTMVIENVIMSRFPNSVCAESYRGFLDRGSE